MAGNLIVKTYILGMIGTNTYLCYDKKSKEAIIIDPADKSKALLKEIEAEELKTKLIVLTHGHWDHTAGVNYIKESLSCPVACHEEELPFIMDKGMNLSTFLGMGSKIEKPSLYLKESEPITLGEESLDIIHTPGHTKGSVILLSLGNSFLFTGDTIFSDGIGRTDLPGGDEEELFASIKEHILPLDDHLLYYPGHGASDTIGNFRNWFKSVLS